MVKVFIILIYYHLVAYMLKKNSASFNIYKISRGNVDSHGYYRSNNSSDGTPIAFRPVIILNENVSITSGEGTAYSLSVN